MSQNFLPALPAKIFFFSQPKFLKKKFMYCADYQFHGSSHNRNILLNSEAHVYVHKDPFISNVSALRSLNRNCDWYVLGDDDTIFFVTCE